MDCSMPGFRVLHFLPEFAQIHPHWVGDDIYHLILCRPFLLLPSTFPSIRVFSNELFLCIRWPKYWTLSISPLSEYSRLISFRIDWFHLLAVQGIWRVFSSTSVQKHQFFSAQWRKYSIILNVFNRTEQCAVLDTYNSRSLWEWNRDTL